MSAHPPGIRRGRGNLRRPICYSCRVPFDVLEAAWCSCIARVKSLCCPACLKCFCLAPRSYKQGFWLAAPARLWARRRTEHFVEDVPIRNPDPLALARPLVLVAESEKHVRGFAVRAVSALGYGVIEASRGDEALASARIYTPNLVLSRALLRKGDGRALCRMLKNDPATSAIRVVIMTPLYTAPGYRYEAFRHFGVDDYLTMPLPFATLRRVLEEQLAEVVRVAPGKAGSARVRPSTRN